jgi:hypothetical protein
LVVRSGFNGSLLLAAMWAAFSDLGARSEVHVEPGDALAYGAVMPTAPHPNAKFLGYWRNQHPDSKRLRVAVWQSPDPPYMVLVDEGSDDRQAADGVSRSTPERSGVRQNGSPMDRKKEAAHDGDDSDDGTA